MVDPDQQFRVREGSFNYGPALDREDGDWALRLSTEDGERLELLVDEEAMYDLWVEVQHVPWPRDDTEAGDLRRDLVERAGVRNAEQLREVFGIIKAIDHGNGWSL